MRHREKRHVAHEPPYLRHDGLLVERRTYRNALEDVGTPHIRTTQIYAKITAEKVSRDMEKLAQRIEQMESFICQAI